MSINIFTQELQNLGWLSRPWCILRWDPHQGGSSQHFLHKPTWILLLCCSQAQLGERALAGWSRRLWMGNLCCACISCSFGFKSPLNFNIFRAQMFSVPSSQHSFGLAGRRTVNFQQWWKTEGWSWMDVMPCGGERKSKMRNLPWLGRENKNWGISWAGKDDLDPKIPLWEHCPNTPRLSSLLSLPQAAIPFFWLIFAQIYLIQTIRLVNNQLGISCFSYSMQQKFPLLLILSLIQKKIYFCF